MVSAVVFNFGIAQSAVKVHIAMKFHAACDSGFIHGGAVPVFLTFCAKAVERECFFSRQVMRA